MKFDQEISCKYRTYFSVTPKNPHFKCNPHTIGLAEYVRNSQKQVTKSISSISNTKYDQYTKSKKAIKSKK